MSTERKTDLKRSKLQLKDLSSVQDLKQNELAELDGGIALKTFTSGAGGNGGNGGLIFGRGGNGGNGGA